MAERGDTAVLTLGPVLFNWAPETWRDFYFGIADEAPVDVVFVGEVVCSKRAPFFEPVLADVVERLRGAGKQVVFSTLALIMNERELESVRALAADADLLVEANDIAAVSILEGRRHVIGPLINTYNEGTLEYLLRSGAEAVCMPAELSGEAIRSMAKSLDDPGVIEVQVFGRLPLAISARCYHARSRGLAKDSCQFVCAEDPDGMAVDTLDGTPFLTVNGTQTLSRSCRRLDGEITELLDAGIRRFRLSPMDVDMKRVSRSFRALLDGALSLDGLRDELGDVMPRVSFSNGFYHGNVGAAYISQGE